MQSAFIVVYPEILSLSGTLISRACLQFSITALQCSPPNSPSSVHATLSSDSMISLSVLKQWINSECVRLSTSAVIMFDIGAFNDDSFIYVAAFGMFTDVSYATKQDMKNLLGHTAYLLEGVKRLSSIKSYPMRISYEDACLEGDYIYGMITNSISVGYTR